MPAEPRESTIAAGWGRVLRRRVGALALAAANLAGCAPPARDAGTVVYASGADLESANPLATVHPLSRQVQRHALLVTLARYDAELRPAPYLARRWTWAPDRRTLTFTLASSLRWHDGHPTTAADAAFTLNAARDPATGWARAADLADVTEASAVDDTTLVVRFRRPPPAFPLVLCELPLLPAHLLGAVPHAELRRAPWNLAPVGNGPFRFQAREPGARWLLERNADFPTELGGPPRVERLVIAVVDEATTKFAGLVSGELDVAGIAPTMAALAERDPALRVLTYPVLFSTALIFNPQREPFSDVRVRRAVNLSLRRDRLVSTAFAGLAEPAAGPVPPASPLALPQQAVLDTLLADSLLDAAGWTRGADGRRMRGGRPFTIQLVTVGSADNVVEQLVQADLRDRGIRVEIRQLEMGAFLNAARAPEKRFDVLVAGIPGDVALAYLSGMYDSRQAGGALDYAGFHTPRLDALLAAARDAGAAAAPEAWRAVQRELAQQVPAAWLYHSRGVQGLSRRLHGVTMDLRGELVTVASWTTQPPAPTAPATASARP